MLYVTNSLHFAVCKNCFSAALSLLCKCKDA